MSNKTISRLRQGGKLVKSSSACYMHTDDDFDGEHFYITAVDVKVFSGKIVSVGQPHRYNRKDDSFTYVVNCHLYPWRELYLPQKGLLDGEEDSPEEIASLAMEAPLELLGKVSGKFVLLFGEYDVHNPRYPWRCEQYLTKYYLRQIRCSGLFYKARRKNALHVAGLTD